ncbi:MAG: hypothetical protein ABFD90_17750 [Phycisphaerales bacterium]
MAIQFKEFVRPAFSGNPEELKKKVIKYCNSELKCFRVISISEAKGMTDDFYRITVWYDDEGQKFEHMLSAAAVDAEMQPPPEQPSPEQPSPTQPPQSSEDSSQS